MDIEVCQKNYNGQIKFEEDVICAGALHKDSCKVSLKCCCIIYFFAWNKLKSRKYNQNSKTDIFLRKIPINVVGKILIGSKVMTQIRKKLKIFEKDRLDFFLQICKRTKMEIFPFCAITFEPIKI